MTRKILRSIVLVALAVLAASMSLVAGVLYDQFEEQLKVELRNQAELIARGMADDGMNFLAGLPRNDRRITWVDASGRVLYDNMARAEEMENHLDREEIQRALSTGFGEMSRRSETLTERTFYSALRLPDGTVLRVAKTYDNLWRLLGQTLWPMAAIMAAAFVFSVLLAKNAARRIVQPINAIDVAHPEEYETYDELAPLIARIESQNRMLGRQMEELKRQQREFSTITENMSEGFLVTDRKTRLLSFNSAALRLLGAQSAKTGESVFSVNRSERFRRAVERAVAGEHSEQLLESGGRYCRLIASPVTENGALHGAILVILDVTDTEAREELRREFTANVSHELKTPLTAISGTAEMLKSGFVKPEDIAHFSENIYKEARRLIALVDDIIHLSRLDEGMAPVGKEPVELYAAAEQAVGRLRERAERADVLMTLEGTKATVFGVPAMIDELITNLCDNAIKYNRPGGSVRISVTQEEDAVRLSVEDTGIGIPPEHHDRVFERFYRVDKSHSRAIGGTGLGLSIVKHIAAEHHAKISLESAENKGTRITVAFPEGQPVCAPDGKG